MRHPPPRRPPLGHMKPRSPLVKIMIPELPLPPPRLGLSLKLRNLREPADIQHPHPITVVLLVANRVRELRKAVGRCEEGGVVHQVRRSLRQSRVDEHDIAQLLLFEVLEYNTQDLGREIEQRRFRTMHPPPRADRRSDGPHRRRRLPALLPNNHADAICSRTAG